VRLRSGHLVELKGAEELHNLKASLQQLQEHAAGIYNVGRSALAGSSRPDALAIPTVDAAEVRTHGGALVNRCVLSLTWARLMLAEHCFAAVCDA